MSGARTAVLAPGVPGWMNGEMGAPIRTIAQPTHGQHVTAARSHNTLDGAAQLLVAVPVKDHGWATITM